MQENLQYIPDTQWQFSERFTEMITFESFFMFWVIYVFIIWLTMIFWVTMDVSNRSSNFFLQLMSILLVTILWPLGFLLYLIVRPSNIVNKQFLSEIEHNLSILWHIVEKSRKGLYFCPKCSAQISQTAKSCPKCKENLEQKCKKCGNVVLQMWKNCPFCSQKLPKQKK